MDFGDHARGSAPTRRTIYAAAGHYTVTLTVTDSSDATGVVSHQVTASTPATNPIHFVGASHSNDGAAKFKEATAPSGAAAGNAVLEYFTQASTDGWIGPTSISGLSRVDGYTYGPLETIEWQRTLTASDLGATVRFNLPMNSKGALTLGVYSGVDTSNPIDVDVAAGNINSTSHTTPTVTSPARDWVVS
ncbi:MAG: hypothetical protein DLM56_00010 [Pseudonocardiales bacterium]|nr:MAG: hypothetical protein DLM56_00010 [Pseudonocardiales bacterium]